MKTHVLVLMVLLSSLFVFAADEFDEFEEFSEAVEQQVRGAQVPDPLEPLNRGIWWLNDKFYLVVLEPVATGYSKVVPEGARKSISHAFKNLQAPERFVNNLLQFKFSDAGTELKRFVCNSTVGVLGLRDPATDRYEMKMQKEDFGQTLGHYGVSPIMTLHLPLLGPSNLRDTAGMIPDMFLNPVYYLESTAAKIGIKSEEVVNESSLRPGIYKELKKGRVDVYRFLQDAYEQNRMKEVEE